jgi:hypothetical protein
MFIFSRPFRAVAGGLAVALVMVLLDRACEPPAAATAMPPAAATHEKAVARACATPGACGIVRAGS